MNFQPTLQEFSKNFVQKEFKERFVHEALKKPVKLSSRLSHKIEEIIPKKYKNMEVEFSEKDTCLLIMNDLEELPWKEIKKYLRDGAGKLIIRKDGKSFYAETEAEFGSPSFSYGGTI